MKSTIKNIVIAAMFASLACVATMLIKIPTPLKGYMNLGDCVVLLSGWLLPAPYAFLAAGVGSALADLFAGYIVYTPATFLIKGIMALIALFGCKVFGKAKKGLPAKLISGFLAELFMVAGYYVFEGFMYGFIPSLANIPANAIQGAAGLLLGVLLVKVFEKNKILH